MDQIKVVMMRGRWTAWIDDLNAVSDRVTAVAAETDEDLMREIVDADVVYGRLPREPFRIANKLKWVQSIGVGFETMLYPEMIDSNVVITNTAGAFDSAMAEHALALILSFTRGIIFCERNRKGHLWQQDVPISQIDGQTACVLGLGSIGRAIIDRLPALGVTVTAVDAQVTDPPDGVSKLYSPDQMLDAVAEADFVIVALPLTDGTRGLINADCFARMKDTGYLVNIARGPIVNQADLINALRAHQIAGAGMDVFEKEPLPEDSPLWEMENVVLTPHLGGRSEEGGPNMKNIFVENLKRYVEGKNLLNIIDKQKGYLIQ
ncbi:MAG: D-2-hydroxyacid dehydrogenase [bacterium]|nr:D-2-hydroxyacid dehydrogenase [bacterium]